MRRLATAAIAAAAVLVLGCDLTGGGAMAEDTATLLGEFSDRMRDASGTTYTATYAIDGETVTYARRPPDLAMHTNAFRYAYTATHQILCEGSTCRRAPNATPSANRVVAAVVAVPGLVNPEGVVGLVLAAALVPGAKVKLNDRTMGGEESLCGDITGLDEAVLPGEPQMRNFSLCVARNGVLTSFTGILTGDQTTRLELTDLRESADTSAFEAPPGAEVTDVPKLFP